MAGKILMHKGCYNVLKILRATDQHTMPYTQIILLIYLTSKIPMEVDYSD